MEWKEEGKGKEKGGEGEGGDFVRAVLHVTALSAWQPPRWQVYCSSFLLLSFHPLSPFLHLRSMVRRAVSSVGVSMPKRTNSRRE